ncbi:MAG: AAA family ATPase, partial [Gammaproteobacteria bacterium]|nr:AAA family ATPase [Gammaproteobacteria bacterium]
MYDQYYNLQSMPFRLTPDPKFLFHSRGHSKALAYLRYGLQQGEGFVVITGEVGAGKTTLVRALDSQLRMSNVVATELVTTNLDPEELLRMVASGFGLSNDDLSKTALLKVLKNFFSARAREGKRILLVIDECHNLSASSLEELRMLSNFQAGDR